MWRLERVDRIAMIARWRPVHLGQAPVLRGLCEHGAEALIGIGSANRYDARNPFTAEETCDMIRLVLEGRTNYRLLKVPDLGDGPRWREMVIRLLGPVNLYVTDNPYVASLLASVYRITRPVELVRAEERVPIDGTMVRRAMARGDNWKELVPPEVVRYIGSKGLDERFRREFGLQTLALGITVEE